MSVSVPESVADRILLRSQRKRRSGMDLLSPRISIYTEAVSSPSDRKARMLLE